MPVVAELDLDDALALSDEVAEVCTLVLVTLAPDQRSLRVVALRPPQLAARDRKLEGGQMLALEKVVES